MSAIITPLRSVVLVELRDAAEREGAIVIVRADRPPSTRATVIAVGDEVRDLGPGVNVVISRLQGIEIAGGALLIDESAVLATEPHDDADETCGATYDTPHELAVCILDKGHIGKHDTGDGGTWGNNDADATGTSGGSCHVNGA